MAKLVGPVLYDWGKMIPMSGIGGTVDSNESPIVEGGGVVDTIISKLPFELHINDVKADGTKRKYNFCGPGTRLDKRLDKNDVPHYWSMPINELDSGCYHHDLAYRANKTAETRHPADLELARVANKVAHNPNASVDERKKADLVASVMHGKRLFGLGNMNSPQVFAGAGFLDSATAFAAKYLVPSSETLKKTAASVATSIATKAVNYYDEKSKQEKIEREEEALIKKEKAKLKKLKKQIKEELEEEMRGEKNKLNAPTVNRTFGGRNGKRRRKTSQS